MERGVAKLVCMCGAIFARRIEHGRHRNAQPSELRGMHSVRLPELCVQLAANSDNLQEPVAERVSRQLLPSRELRVSGSDSFTDAAATAPSHDVVPALPFQPASEMQSCEGNSSDEESLADDASSKCSSKGSSENASLNEASDSCSEGDLSPEEAGHEFNMDGLEAALLETGCNPRACDTETGSGSNLLNNPEDMFPTPQTLSDSTVELPRDILTPVSARDRRTIHFMLKCANGAGLSRTDRLELFDIVKSSGGFSGFETCHAMWCNFVKRFEAVQYRVGNFRALKISYDDFLFERDRRTGDEARVRCVRSSIKFVFENLCRTAKNGSPAEKELLKYVVYEARAEFDNSPSGNGTANRIIGSIWTADAAIRLQNRLQPQPVPHSATGVDPVHVLLVSLFVDKHNVTKLNKRSLYAVILFIKSLDHGRLQFLHSMVVGYIPYPPPLSDLGTPLNTDKTKHIRRMAVQQTMKALLFSATGGDESESIFTMQCPDGRQRRFKISVFGTADSPEVCMQTGGRSGTGLVKGTARPDPQCNMPLRHSQFFRREETNGPKYHRTAAHVLSVYREMEQLPTVAERDKILKRNSLNLPKSAWLDLPDVDSSWDSKETDVISVPILDVEAGKESFRSLSIERFGFHVLFPLEYLHTMDLGIVVDMLKKSTEYVQHCLSSNAHAQLVLDKASANRIFLNRNSLPEVLSRLATPGLSVAESHANVTGKELSSFGRVFPFLLAGSHGVLKDEDEQRHALRCCTLPLLRYSLALARLCCFLECDNSAPFFAVESLTAHLPALLDDVTITHQKSLGLVMAAKPERRGGDIGVDGSKLFMDIPHTIKHHRLMRHTAEAITMYGLPRNFSATQGEHALAADNKVQARTSRGSETDGNRLASQTQLQRQLREAGVFELMYPMESQSSLLGRASESGIASVADCSVADTDGTENPPPHDPMNTRDGTDCPAGDVDSAAAALDMAAKGFLYRINCRKRDCFGDIHHPALDGISVREFQRLLNERADGSALSSISTRRELQSLAVVSGVKFTARFPWLSSSVRECHPLAISKMSGRAQTVGTSVRFVHVRAVFRLPLDVYKDCAGELGGCVLLVRVLEACPDVSFLLESAGLTRPPKHATPLQSGLHSENADAKRAQQVMNWLSQGISDAQIALDVIRSEASDVDEQAQRLAGRLFSEGDWSIVDNLWEAKAVESMSLEPLTMLEYGCDRLAYEMVRNRPVVSTHEMSLRRQGSSERRDIARRSSLSLSKGGGTDPAGGQSQQDRAGQPGPSLGQRGVGSETQAAPVNTVRGGRGGRGRGRGRARGRGHSCEPRRISRGGSLPPMNLEQRGRGDREDRPGARGDAGEPALCDSVPAEDSSLEVERHPGSDVRHAVLGIKDIYRIVSVQPDMSTPVEFAEGSATARALVAEEISRDSKREKSEKTALAAKIRRLVQRGKDTERVAATVIRPAKSEEDIPSPAAAQNLAHCRFYHNIYARLTRPG